MPSSRCRLSAASRANVVVYHEERESPVSLPPAARAAPQDRCGEQAHEKASARDEQENHVRHAGSLRERG